MAAAKFDGIKTSKVSPRFLHGNSTSHTWLFSAFAELIDNAYDPDVHASEIWIDVRNINNHDCVTFVDNGNGMTPDKLYKMLSFGYCEKVAVGNIKPIGFYGNGFKSGSMRIGKDALVFTRCQTSMSVGMLSQTYLQAIKAEAVIVPIVTFDLPSKLRQNTSESLANMKAIMRHSIFNSEHQLINELRALEKMQTGTNIIIYNLNKDKSGNYEIDFESDKYDIRNPETSMIDLSSINRPIHQSSPEYKRSLREYCSILYLKPRMKIKIRGKKVSTTLISKSLSKTETDVYKPSWLPRPVRLTFGFTHSEDPENYGLMMYHENRLIRAYEKIGCQKQANDHGIGVVGVVEANFLQPIHNKQDFNRTEKYAAFMQNAATKLNDYYYEKSQITNPDAAPAGFSQMSQLPDWTWVQCENCLSWRRLPTGYDKDLPDKWYCRMNPDAAFNRCDIPEEPEDDDLALQVTYKKTYKKSLEGKKRQAKLEEERKLREREEELQKKEKILQKRLKSVNKKAKQQEELGEVSSSQDKVDRKPTVGDLEKAKKSIVAYQEQMKQKEQTIIQLEEQKKKIEEKSQAMLRMAESLKLSTDQGSSLLDKIHALSGTDTTAVTSSSGTSSGLRAPKRKQDMTSDDKADGEPQEKIVKIKTEEGGFIPVKITSTGSDECIDLTLDEEDLDTTDTANKTNTEITADKGLTEMEDVKPDKAQLDEQIRKEKAAIEELYKTSDTESTSMNDKDNDITDTISEKEKENETITEDREINENDTSVIDSEKKKSAKKKESEKTVNSEKSADAETAEADKIHDSESKESEKTADSEKTAVPENPAGSEKQVDAETAEAEKMDDSDKTAEVQQDEAKDDEKKDIKTKIKEEIKREYASSHCQTVPTIVKFASPEEIVLTKLSPVEQKEMMLLKARELDEKDRELEETTRKLSSLQDNIWKLLKIIVPDFDYGEPSNIENTIVDFIRVNEEQDSQD